MSVECLNYFTSFSFGGNGGIGNNTSREFFVKGHLFRLRQTATITDVEFVWNNSTGVTGAYFKVWRKDADGDGLYDLVGTSENIFSQLVPGAATKITLSSPITGVQEGDFYTLRLEGPGGQGGSANLVFDTGSSAKLAGYIVNNSTPATTDFDWEAQTSGGLLYVKVKAYCAPPDYVTLGDSILGGQNEHRSYITNIDLAQDDSKSSPETSCIGVASTLFGDLRSYQNMCIGGNTTGQMASRASADAVALTPNKVIILSGMAIINDIKSAVSAAASIANMNTLMDTIETAGKKCLIMGPTPWTGGTVAQNQDKDARYTSLAAAVTAHSGTNLLIDTRPSMGQDRVGEAAGNLWDLKTAYDSDGAHLTAAGQAELGRLIYAALTSMDSDKTVTPDTNTSKNLTPTTNTAKSVSPTTNTGASVMPTINTALTLTDTVSVITGVVKESAGNVTTADIDQSGIDENPNDGTQYDKLADESDATFVKFGNDAVYTTMLLSSAPSDLKTLTSIEIKLRTRNITENEFGNDPLGINCAFIEDSGLGSTAGNQNVVMDAHTTPQTWPTETLTLSISRNNFPIAVKMTSFGVAWDPLFDLINLARARFDYHYTSFDRVEKTTTATTNTAKTLTATTNTAVTV